MPLDANCTVSPPALFQLQSADQLQRCAVYVLALHSRPGALGTLDLREEGKSDNIYTARKVSSVLLQSCRLALT